MFATTLLFRCQPDILKYGLLPAVDSIIISFPSVHARSRTCRYLLGLRYMLTLIAFWNTRRTNDHTAPSSMSPNTSALIFIHRILVAARELGRLASFTAYMDVTKVGPDSHSWKLSDLEGSGIAIRHCTESTERNITSVFSFQRLR